MTSRWFKKCSSKLAFGTVCFLALLIISLIIAAKFWTHQQQTVSTPNTSSSNRWNNESTNSGNLGNTDTTIKDANSDDRPQSIAASEKNAWFVFPVKIETPLHEDDLLYESKHPNTGGSNSDHSSSEPPSAGHITGQFRSKSQRIWDPHPTYVFDAFGRIFYLDLKHNTDFMSEDTKVTHVWQNQTLRKHEDHHDHKETKACFYRGSVRGDEHSRVSVNLCEGMRGIIVTSNASYVIQPVEEYNNESTNQHIKHRLNQLASAGTEGNNEENGELINAISKCGADDFEFKLPPQHSLTRRKRSTSQLTGNNEYTIEVLVAVDKRMKEYHGPKWQSYVLTLMSIVSSIYADASIGNSIKIAVVHILVIEHDLVTNHNNGVSAAQMLESFCQTKNTYGYHHDTALLLTREQICRSPNERKCDTLGLAELGTVCSSSSCSIVQDNGLSAAFTIAHELGHVLSAPHDDDPKCDKYFGMARKSANIMSRMLDQNTYPWSWSVCSRQFISDFLENATCLLDRADKDLITPSHELAGEKFSDNEQCQLVFGPGSKICSFMPRCGRLWCSEDHNEQYGCRTQHMPWADGTTCGINLWCQKGECVPRNRSAVLPQDGGWGQWSGYSECSRSCGRGVQTSSRECNSPAPANGGKYCIGQRARHKICNEHECPHNAKSFREEQCEEFNNNNMGLDRINANVRWVPKYGAPPDEECKLYCRVTNKNYYFLLKDRVKDGTPCTNPIQSSNICMSGRCRNVGCDNIFDSDAKLDKCGVCKGKGDTCVDVIGGFPHSEMYYKKKPFHQKIIRIPKGATNIEIRQPGYHNDENFISLASDEGEYILNPPDMTPKKGLSRMLYEGVIIDYSGPDSIEERVNSTFGRKLKRDLVVEIYSVKEMDPIQENIIEFKYTMPTRDDIIYSKSINQINYPLYQWKMGEWSECIPSCSGKRNRTAHCIDLETGKEKAHSYCRTSVKPRDEFEICNMDCKFEWEEISSECSNPCGEGVKVAKYQCIQRSNKKQTMKVDPDKCSTVPKPVSREKCFGPCVEAVWSYGDWGVCSKNCGGGQQNRTVICISSPDEVENQIDDSYCERRLKEETVTYCNSDPCPEWATGEYTPCSVTCGEGKRSTAIYCKQNNVIVNSALCGSFPRPVAMLINCTMPPCEKKQPHRGYKYSVDNESRRTFTIENFGYSSYPDIIRTEQKQSPPEIFKYEWRTSIWGECSASCNGGYKYRSVKCINYTNTDTQDYVDDRHCDDSKKPTNMNPCGNFRCPKWNTGQWNECNDDCKRYRQVLCQDHRNKESHQCPKEMKPAEIESCCQFRWRTVWKTCNATCGEGYRSGERVCMRLLPRSPDNPHPIKKGKKVDAKFCANLKAVNTKPLMKKCKKHCEFRWEVAPWSKCSVGCGTGWTTRNVTCTNGKTVSNDCDKKTKPINTKQCETRSHCAWKFGKWKSCKCEGFRKRRVVCFDSLRNHQATSCTEDSRPPHREQCTPPPNCSCRGLQQHRNVRKDGEYMLNVKGKHVSIYCHNMNSSKPIEYLTLKAGINENYSIYYNKRAYRAGTCDTRGDWVDNSIAYGSSHFHKVRLNIHTLQVTDDDFEFADTVGIPQMLGSAGDCYSNSGHCPQGDFSINLEGTPFRLRPRTHWETKGLNAVMRYLTKLEHPYQKIRARCGGYCGSCFVSRNTSLHLDLL